MRLFVAALEPSSNLHLRNLKKELLQDYEIIGVCDSDIGNPIFLPSDFSIMGFVDVGRKILFFKKALKILSIEAAKSDKILLMDSSSFNIRLAKLIREINPNIEIMYYILPQVWAWKPWRATLIESLCDKLACIWKFELDYYKSKARYMGHPLLDIYKEEHVYNKDSRIFVFMPGSRKSEIKRLMVEYRILANMLLDMFKDCKLRIIIPEKFKDSNMEVYGNLDNFEICFSTQEGLSNAHFAFVCAGTATLEASLMGIPFVLVYKAKWIDYIIVKIFVRLKYVGLANIIYQAMQGGDMKRVGRDDLHLHDELLQSDCKAEKMLAAYRNFDYDKYFNNIHTLRKYLGHGSAKNVAKWLEER